MSEKFKHHLPALAILLLAFALRLIAIDQIPPGLSHDEAYNGVTALQVLAGQHRIFFEINKGIEPLIIYLEALAFYLFGVGPVQLRLVNVFCGLLTVVLAYPLTRRLFNRRVALLAMAGLAISFWAIFVSRLTLRAVTLPPLLLLTLYLFWRGLEASHASANASPPLSRQPWLLFGVSGLVAGAAMYTYLSSRFIPLIILSVFGAGWLWGGFNRRRWLGLILHLGLWAAVFAPLATYYVENWDSFTRRSDQVSTLASLVNGEVGPTLTSARLTLGMFTFHGDETDRYNLDGRPVFDWLNGTIFYLGLGLVLWQGRAGPKRTARLILLFSWSFFMLLPDFITDDSPHFLRTIGALPPVYIFWAVGLGAITNWLATFRRAATLQLILPGLLILLTTLHTSYDYFWRWAAAPEARFIYGADIAQIADRLKHTPDDELPTISAEYYRDLDPFRFDILFGGDPPFAIWFDGRQSLAFPPPQSGLQPRYFFAASAPASELWQPFLQPTNNASAEAYQLYRLPNPAQLHQAWADTFPVDTALNVTLHDDLAILNYRIFDDLVNGGQVRVLIGWQALRTLPPDTDYTFLIRLRDEAAHLWAQADGNGYAPGDWQPGVLGLQLLTLRLPSDLPPRRYTVTIEVVDRHSGQSLSTNEGERVINLPARLGQLSEHPREANPTLLPNPTQISLALSEGSLTLRGYALTPETIRLGDTLSLTLHWQVVDSPEAAYQLELFLQNEASPDKPVYRWPALDPIGGEWPTNQWPAGYWVQDRLAVVIDPALPPGRFHLRGRWVEPETGQPVSSSFEIGLVEIEADN